MAESWIKIRATVNEIHRNFENCPSKLYYIKYYDGTKDYKGNPDEKILFNALIRHNEIGNRKLERSQPYTLDTLEKNLTKKVKEYNAELKNELNKEVSYER